KVAAGEEWHTERGEVSRRNEAELHSAGSALWMLAGVDGNVHAALERKAWRQCCPIDARDGANALEQISEELVRPRRVIAGWKAAQFDRGHAGRVEAWVDVGQARKARREQCGAGEQHDSRRGLDEDERLARARAAAGRTPGAAEDSRMEPQAERRDGRGEAKYESCDDGDRDGVGEHAAVERGRHADGEHRR